MSVNDIETANRYFKYDLCQKNNTNGLRWYIPPLVENQFSTQYKCCLAKIKSIYVQTGNEGKAIDWTDGTNGNILPRGGVKVESNLISRNYCSIGDGDVVTPIGQKSNNNPINTRFGVMMNLDGHDAVSQAQGSFVYEDYNSVFDSGLICSLPFGKVLEFNFFEGCGGDRKKLFPSLAGATAPDGQTTISIEFFLIN